MSQRGKTRGGDGDDQAHGGEHPTKEKKSSHAHLSRRSPSAGRSAALLFAWALVVFLLCPVPRASAEGRVAFLTERVRYPPAAGHVDDFRVRTNAALALGATNDDAAVAPLCGALSDPSEVVRQASAVALKRLARSAAIDCLKGRIAVEGNESVKQEVQRAIDALTSSRGGGGGGGSGAPVVANARYYVSVSRVANHTSRESEEVERVVHDAIASKLAEVGGYQLAPPGETTESAKAAIAKRHLKGYFLAVSVDKFEYSGDGLRVRVKIAVFSYPGRDLRGEVPAGAVLPGGHPGDKASEDELMGVVAARAAELFTQNFQ